MAVTIRLSPPPPNMHVLALITECSDLLSWPLVLQFGSYGKISK